MSISSESLEEFITLIDSYIDRGVTDGLPVIPPSKQRVEEMIAAIGRRGVESLGPLAPSYRELTIADVAVNATMAGCLPKYMPIIVGALEVMMGPTFGLHHMSTTTYGNAPLLIVNGPIRNTVGINCQRNVLGPGNRANATIGRAVSLTMINVGGAIPGLTEFSSFGHPGKYTYVIGEDEENSPWEPLHVQLGYQPSESTVAVMGAGPMLRIGGSVSRLNPEQFLGRVANVLSATGGFGSTGWSEEFIFFGPEHREGLADAGWTKDDIRSFLHQHAGRVAGDTVSARSAEGMQADRQLFPADDPRNRLPILNDEVGRATGEWIPAFESSADIHIVAAGGYGGGGGISMMCSGQPGLDWGRHGQMRI